MATKKVNGPAWDLYLEIKLPEFKSLNQKNEKLISGDSHSSEWLKKV